jgi:hypothetical protein
VPSLDRCRPVDQYAEQSASADLEEQGAVPRTAALARRAPANSTRQQFSVLWQKWMGRQRYSGLEMAGGLPREPLISVRHRIFQEKMQFGAGVPQRKKTGLIIIIAYLR